MQKASFKKTFVLRVALAAVLSVFMSFSSLCYTETKMSKLEARILQLEASGPAAVPSQLDLKLSDAVGSFITDNSYSNCAEQARKVYEPVDLDSPLP